MLTRAAGFQEDDELLSPIQMWLVAAVAVALLLMGLGLLWCARSTGTRRQRRPCGLQR